MAPTTSVAEEPTPQLWFYSLRLIGCDKAILACYLTPPLVPAPLPMMREAFQQVKYDQHPTLIHFCVFKML